MKVQLKKKSIINNLYDQKETEEKYLDTVKTLLAYLDTVKTLLAYWKKELGSVNIQSKERHAELLRLTDAEESTIYKIMKHIRRINEMIIKLRKTW